MDTVHAPGSDAARVTLELLDDLFGHGGDVGVRLWDGTRWPADERPRAATLVLRHPGALRAMFRAGTELALSEAYLHDDFDIEGDIFAVHVLADTITGRTTTWSRKASLFAGLGRLPGASRQAGGRAPARLTGRRHSVERDREAIRYHYDVSNDFYRVFLDDRMVYSCGYFADAATGLETAQLAKLDLVCRKLRLRPGQRLLDIGCGWGGLVMHAAREYGVDATGITLSHRQCELAAARIEAAGLAETCRVHYLDYRAVAEGPALGRARQRGNVRARRRGDARYLFPESRAHPGAGRRVPEPRHRLAGHRPLRARPELQQLVRLPRRRNPAHQRVAAGRRGVRGRGARRRELARALRADAPPLGAAPGGRARGSAATRGRADVPGVATVPVGILARVRDRPTQHLPGAPRPAPNPAAPAACR